MARETSGGASSGSGCQRKGDVQSAAERHARSIGAGFGSSALLVPHELSSLVCELVELGRGEEAARRARQLQEAADGVEDLRGLEARVGIALAAAATDDAEAAGLLQRAIEIARRYHLPFVEVAGLDVWAARTGRVDHLDAAAALLDQIGARGDWVEWLASRRSRLDA